MYIYIYLPPGKLASDVNLACSLVLAELAATNGGGDRRVCDVCEQKCEQKRAHNGFVHVSTASAPPLLRDASCVQPRNETIIIRSECSLRWIIHSGSFQGN